MSEYTCPHCHGSVSRGASVCRGCQAEVEYGAPKASFIVAFFLSLFLSAKAAEILPDWIAVSVFIISMTVGIFGATHLFKDRVIFKRMYRSK